MKKLKLYKKAIAVIAAGSFVLFCGCSSKTNTNNEEITNPTKESCIHLTVYFEDKPITFKECEGYEINYEIILKGGYIRYDILKDDTKVISYGRTPIYNKYEVDHEVSDEIFDNESMQKFK